MTDIKDTTNDGRISVYKFGTDKFKSENISIFFAVPPKRKASVARTLLLSVLKRGTEKFPTQKDINERLDELYATLVNFKNQKFDGLQLLGLSADIIRAPYLDGGVDLLPDVLEVIAEMLFHPALDGATGTFFDEYVRSEKENYKSIINSQMNEPRSYAAIRCREEMFSSLGVIDRLQTVIERIDESDTQALYDEYQYILNNAKIVVFYVGERSSKDIYEEICKILPSTVGKDVVISNHAPLLLENMETPIEIIEDFPVYQGRLIMGFNCRVTWSDDDYCAMLLCNEILGASPVAKLFMKIREEMSLCYECSSVYNSARGAIIVTTGIDSENYELCRDEVMALVRNMQNGDITEAELSAAKKSLVNVYSAIKDSPSAIEKFYLGRAIHGINLELDSFVEKFNALTREDVIRCANMLSLHTVYFLRGEEEEACDE